LLQNDELRKGKYVYWLGMATVAAVGVAGGIYLGRSKLPDKQYLSRLLSRNLEVERAKFENDAQRMREQNEREIQKIKRFGNELICLVTPSSSKLAASTHSLHTPTLSLLTRLSPNTTPLGLDRQSAFRFVDARSG
jgi:hypothetical protein